MYPVDIISNSVCFNIGAEIICFPIKRSGFLPEIRERNKIPSALGFICMAFPGKSITGIFEFSFIVFMQSLRLSFMSKLPPTKK